MNAWERVRRHLRITSMNYGWVDAPTPPFLILFINSICNQTCEHCFYWRNLNRRDDLTVDELQKLSQDLGPIENLNLSGGEPFLRKEFGEICRFFIRNNGVKQIYVPTNGSFADRTVKALEEVFKEPGLELFAAELSLDGMHEFHDSFRGMKDAFERSMGTYDALAEMQKREPRLRIHSVSTVTDTNVHEIRRLTSYLYERCPQMDHHNLAIIRGDRKNPSLQGPALEEYKRLYDYMKSLWAPRETGRYGAIVEPLLQAAKTRTSVERRQVVPCRAGILTGVVYSNGDVSLCETHAPIGNIREKTFRQIWHSEEATKLRASIAARECYCTNEVFLWPSIVYQPPQLVKVIAQARPWEKPKPVPPSAPPPPPSEAKPPELIVLR
ncbi:MAG: radical SAM protein [Bryobacteraceae bacterium]|nr:radical SAM protein [Bryobacteraceae bacterium]